VVCSQFSLFDQFYEGWNDGDFFVRRDQVKNLGVNDVNSRKLVCSLLLMNKAADIGHEVTLHSDTQIRPVTLDCQSCGVVGGHMARHEPVNREIGDNVTIIN